MRHAPLAAVVVAAAVTAGPSAAPVKTPLDRAEVSRALQVARGSERARAGFHEAYVIPMGGPVVERIEIVTEFRRLVLLAEERQRQGNWIFSRSTADAERALEPWRGLLAIVARLRFNPLNVYAAVPPAAVLVAGPADQVEATATESTALRADSPAGRPGESPGAILGALVESRFDAARLAATAAEVRVVLDGAIVARTPVDFGRLE